MAIELDNYLFEINAPVGNLVCVFINSVSFTPLTTKASSCIFIGSKNVKIKIIKTKILKQVEYESARRKRHINEITRIRDEKGSTFFLCIFTFFYFVENGSEKLIFRKLKGTQVNLGFFKGSARRSRELKGTQRKSRELKGTWVSSREALVEVMKGNE